MMSIVRRIRGALVNALVWGAAWGGAGFAYLSALHLAGGMPEAQPWRLIFYVSANLGVTGFIAGGAFSAYLARAYRDQDLLDIRPVRFAAGGALTAGALSSLASIVARSFTEAGVGFDATLASGMWGVVLGGVTAAGTIKLAQAAARRLNSASRAELGAGVDEAFDFGPRLATESRPPLAHARSTSQPMHRQ